MRGTSFSDEEFFSKSYAHFTKKHPEITAFMDGIKSLLLTNKTTNNETL